MDVSCWLRDLGLEDYAQAFRGNDIDAEVLRRLTADDLIALGITSVGHRRKLLDAIAALRGGLALDSAEPPSKAAPRPADAERRQLTVLFCDLVGSTELSARLDAEELREVIGAYQACVAAVVHRWEGHLAKYMGDGALAYFGWPRAHEDDAERAVRAGLDLVDAVGGLPVGTEARLQARVGIATGQVVVGDLIGQDSADKDSVIGETPNLAARLQALAEPGTVIISQATRRLVGGLFELDDLGPQRLKGFSEPLSVWRIAGESRAESRFEALRGKRLTPLVGREHELGLLVERWAWAKDGAGQVVLISGESGIGKSRLVRSLRERIEGERYIQLSHYCSPYHTNSVLYPVVGLLERAAGFEREDPPTAKLAKLEALLKLGTEKLDETLSLIGALLSIPTRDRSPALDLTPQRQRQRTLQVLIEQLKGLARRQPVLAVYEDVHWIDPSTRELLDLVVEEVQHLPVLALIAFRPEFSPPWIGHAHVAMLTLNRLGRPQGEALVHKLTGAKALPKQVRDQILGKTDGVPLFVEELTKTVLESGLLKDAGDRYELSGPLPLLAIPATLQDSLLARLDRAPAVKEVAQIGAAIGREFSYALLAAVADRPEDDLGDALDQLTASELIFRRGTPPDAIYSFKHALVQDAAYGTLLRGRRQQLHARVAKMLEGRFADVVESRPELLAHHYTEAGLTEKGAFYWQRAGERSARASADLEAVAHLKKCLELVERLPESRARAEQALGLCLTLGSALSNLQGSGGAEVGQVYLRARELCERVGQPEQLFAVLWGLWGYHHMNGRLEEAERLADEVVRLGEQLSDKGFLLQAHHAAWTNHGVRGNLSSAYRHAEQGISLYDFDQHRSHAFIYGGHDPGLCAGWHMAEIAWALGFPDRALEHAHDSLNLGRRLSHPIGMAMVQSMMVNIHAFRGELESAITHAEEMLRYTAEHDITIWLVNAKMLRAWVLTALGRGHEVIEEFRDAVEQRAARGARRRQSFYLALLADAYEKSDQPDEGIHATDQALELIATTGEERWAPMVYRVRATLLAGSTKGRPAAEDCFIDALQAARTQDAKSFELQAAMGLARLWREQGKIDEARDLLAPVYGWFTEGFDTQDLKEAKALLDELS